MPSTPYDAKGLLKAAIRDDNPVVYLGPAMLSAMRGPVPDLDQDYIVPLGVADVKRAGTDVTIVATGWMVPHSLAAADSLAEQDIEVEVIDPRTLKPLDLDTIADSVRKTKRLVVVNEAPGIGSVASEIAASVQEACFDYLDAPIKRVTGADVPMPFAAELEAMVIPDEQAIIAAVEETVGVSIVA